MKVTEDRPEVSKSKQSWDVLQEREACSYFAKNPCDLGPEVPFVLVSPSLSGLGEWLAREPARNEIHESTPRATIEGSSVVPHREQREVTVRLPPQEDFSAVRVDLNCGEYAMAKEYGSKDPATSAGKECQLIHATTWKPASQSHGE